MPGAEYALVPGEGDAGVGDCEREVVDSEDLGAA